MFLKKLLRYSKPCKLRRLEYVIVSVKILELHMYKTIDLDFGVLPVLTFVYIDVYFKYERIIIFNSCVK